MKIFSNCTVVVEFEPTTSYKEKSTWRKTITENGGVISYILTKKASFFVVFNKKGTSVSFKLKQCARYDIPVVSPKYVQQCVSKNRLLDTDNYRLKDLNNNHEFGKGKIQTTEAGRPRHAKKKTVTVNLSCHPSWLFRDVNAPEFDENAFELPKWALLISKEQKKLEALEVHVSTRLDNSFKYRLYAQSGLIEDKKVVKSEDAVVWYFQTVSEVLSGYEQLYRQYTNKPKCMKVCEPGAVDVENLGSPNLRMVLGKISLLNERITHQVAALTSLIWNEALTEVDTMLETPMKYIQEKQIIEARVVLAQLTEKLIGNHSNREDDVKKLIDQFYEVLPHKEEFRSHNWTLREVIGKQDLCQLLSDIVAVSEATDWSPDATVIAKYRAMGCHMQQVDQSSDDFAKIQDVIDTNLTGTGGKISNVYKVRRTMEEVNFQADVGNVNLLTHATPCYNLLGILSRGLLLPKVVTDKLGVCRTDAGNLGAGIYFSDNPSKSAQYSTQNSQTGYRFLLLCDVALGQSFQVYQSDFSITAPPEGFDSVHGVKATDEKSSTFSDNEFVVYSPSQQCVKYLVEFSLPGDTVKEENHVTDDHSLQLTQMETEESSPAKSSPPEKSLTKNTDISDVKDIPDPLEKVKAGLQGNKNEHIPLKSVHIRGRMMDMVAKVVVLQAYRNDNDKSIEAKYVFPLESSAAVCGFEAFINGKHIIGEVKEKSKARKEYKEAVARGDGAYLMEEETPDVFSVSVGNLPSKSDVLIKITYISELQVQGEGITFNIPASVAPWLREGALAHKTQTTTKSVKVSNNKRCDVSLMVAIEMPFDIRTIQSPSHKVNCKKTATKAVVSLPKKANLDDGFQLNVCLAEVHVPRMWVERHPSDHTQACMLTFYPEFETEPLTEPDILIVLDMSNSMKGDAEEQAKKVALLAMDHLPSACRFNIVVFGSTYRELFPSAQKYNSLACQLAKQFIQEAAAKLGSTELWEPLHAIQTLSSADKCFQSLFLISDGHVTQESTVLKAVKKSSKKIRIFTLGVSSTVNHHLLRSIATLSGGTYEHYNKDTKSQWQGRVLSQLEKACQPGLTDVHVDWLQTNENATPPTQAPNHIPCLFSGCRQVVYGFVESCTQATLRAKINGNEVSTMVSTVDLNITSGTMLHQLVARAVISDYENGNLDDDRIQHQVLKSERKQYIIELSKKHSIVTPYTSFVAIEDRQQEAADVTIIPSIADLIKKETVDILPYIDWEPGIENNDEDPLTCVRDILKRGELQESYSMIQAEETYTGLTDYIEDIKTDSDTLDRVYHTLGKFYEQNHAEVVGNILSEIEEVMIDQQLKQLEVLKSNDFEEYVIFKSSLREDLLSKQHCKKAVAWLDENGWSNTDDQDAKQLHKAEYLELASEDHLALTDEQMADYGTEFGSFEMCSLMPPEVNISLEEIASLEMSLQELASFPLPDDDDDLFVDNELEKSLDKQTKGVRGCEIGSTDGRGMSSWDRHRRVDRDRSRDSSSWDRRRSVDRERSSLDSRSRGGRGRGRRDSSNRGGRGRSRWDTSNGGEGYSHAVKNSKEMFFPTDEPIKALDKWATREETSLKYLQNLDYSTSIFDPKRRSVRSSENALPSLSQPKRLPLATKAARKSAPCTGGVQTLQEEPHSDESSSDAERSTEYSKFLKELDSDKKADTETEPVDLSLHIGIPQIVSSTMSKFTAGKRLGVTAPQMILGAMRHRKVVNSADSDSKDEQGLKDILILNGTGPASVGTAKPRKFLPEHFRRKPELATLAAQKSAPAAELIGNLSCSSESDCDMELIEEAAGFFGNLPETEQTQLEDMDSTVVGGDSSTKSVKLGGKRTFTAPRKQLATKAARKSAPVITSSSSDSDSDSDELTDGSSKENIEIKKKNVGRISSDSDEDLAEGKRKIQSKVKRFIVDEMQPEKDEDNEEEEIYVAEKLPFTMLTQNNSDVINVYENHLGSFNQSSPAYRPTQSSYSPVSPAFNQPVISYGQQQSKTDICSFIPTYSPTSPSFSPTSPSYSPTSPAFYQSEAGYGQQQQQTMMNFSSSSVRLRNRASTEKSQSEQQLQPQQQQLKAMYGYSGLVTQKNKKALTEKPQSRQIISTYYAPDFVPSSKLSSVSYEKEYVRESNKSFKFDDPALKGFGNQTNLPHQASPKASVFGVEPSLQPQASANSIVEVSTASKTLTSTMFSLPSTKILDPIEPLVCHQAAAVKTDETFRNKRRNQLQKERYNPLTNIESKSKNRNEHMLKRHELSSKQENSDTCILDLPGYDRAAVENAAAGKSVTQFSERESSYKRKRKIRGKIQYGDASERSKGSSVIRQRSRSYSRSLSRTRSARRWRSSFSRSVSRERAPNFDGQRSRSRSRGFNGRQYDRNITRFRDRVSYSRSKTGSRGRGFSSPRRSRSSSPWQRRSRKSSYSRSRTRSRDRRYSSPRRSRSSSPSQRRSRNRSYRNRTRSRDRRYCSPRRPRSSSPWQWRSRNRSYISRTRSRDRRYSSLRRSRSSSPWQWRSRNRSYRSRTRSRDRRYRSPRISRSSSPWQWRSRNRSYKSRTRSRGYRPPRRSGDSSPWQRRSRNRSHEKTFSRSTSERRSYSRSRSRSKSRRHSSNFFADKKRSRSASAGSHGYSRPLRVREITAKRKTDLISVLDNTLEGLDTSLNISNVWQGVRVGNSVKYLQREPYLSKLKNCLQMADDSTTEKTLCFFELSEELCSLIDINRARFVQILNSQGVKSLGCRTEQIIYRVMATLLVLVVCFRRYLSYTKHLPTDSTVTYDVQENFLKLSINGNKFSIKFRNSLNINGIINWLELMDKELPPLYNTLELGKTRIDFLSQLVSIYRDI